ncbi:MAG: hypothetical protein KAV87_22605, partial [Desulfobacteraceae bacterium]|nr:hypothetical protein [Desulfobacteraceae bacterium]
MRRFIKRISPDTGVGAEDPELVWHQTLRSIGRIEQLEAKEDDLRKKFRQIQQILKYSGSSQWATTESQFPTPHLSWQEVAEAPDVFFEFDEDVGSWEPAQLVKQPVGPAIDRIV